MNKERFSPLLCAYRAYLAGIGQSAGTIKRTKVQIKVFLLWYEGTDIRDITRETIYAFKHHLITEKSRLTRIYRSAETVMSYLKAVKRFTRYLFDSGYIITDPGEGVSVTVAGIKRMRKIFSEEEIASFLDSIDGDTHTEVRDRAFFELLYSSALRVGECLSLQEEDVNFDERVLMVKKGKGKKDRYVPFSVTARVFLLRYLNGPRKHHLKRAPGIHGCLFPGNRGRMDYGRLRNRFKSYLKRAGLEKSGLTMHSIRHATATHLLRHGAGIRYVQELLGHADLKTTQTYTRPGNDQVLRMYKTYHPRENEYYKEMDDAYLRSTAVLKKETAEGRVIAKRYRETGTTVKKGCKE